MTATATSYLEPAHPFAPSHHHHHHHSPSPPSPPSSPPSSHLSSLPTRPSRQLHLTHRNALVSHHPDASNRYPFAIPPLSAKLDQIHSSSDSNDALSTLWKVRRRLCAVFSSCAGSVAQSGNYNGRLACGVNFLPLSPRRLDPCLEICSVARALLPDTAHNCIPAHTFYP
ncbi:hypothetical protein BKA57DRAFT_458566 [Linnemannia elongata]|nr:hypothetical protein BKA57DRAFT_458566 [Linnemannia elongata]